LLYPRALALHIEALGACDPLRDASRIELHRVIVLRVIRRIEQLAREPSMPASFARLAPLGRHLLVWVLQYFRHEPALASTLDWFAEAHVQDRELRLAHGALQELRATPDAVAASPRLQTFDTPFPRETVLAQEEARRLNVAVRTYTALLADDPDVLEAHLRVARLLLRLGRHEDAAPHLDRVAALGPDARQTYLSQLFLADVRERRGDRAGAIQAYRAALVAWPTAQAPTIAQARLHVLERDGAGARAALAAVHAERDPSERSDPWTGYMGCQSWRLPEGLVALQGSLEPL
jgi:tetratricopeptide (TPR) repeat protein